MRFHVAQLLKESPGSRRDYELAETLEAISKDVPVAGRLTGRVRLTRTSAGVLVHLRGETVVRLTCSRCLGEYGQPLAFAFEEEYLPLLDIATGQPLSLSDESAFRIGSDHILDLAEAVRQYALVGMPMKPLCGEDCAGLCIRCGQNLNLGRCACPPAEPGEGSTRLGDLLAMAEVNLEKEG